MLTDIHKTNVGHGVNIRVAQSLVPRHINYEIYHMDSLCDNAALTNTYDVSLLNGQCTSNHLAGFGRLNSRYWGYSGMCTFTGLVDLDELGLWAVQTGHLSGASFSAV